MGADFWSTNACIGSDKSIEGLDTEEIGVHSWKSDIYGFISSDIGIHRRIIRCCLIFGLDLDRSKKAWSTCPEVLRHQESKFNHQDK
jgi:hypothetical protein